MAAIEGNSPLYPRSARDCSAETFLSDSAGGYWGALRVGKDGRVIVYEADWGGPGAARYTVAGRFASAEALIAQGMERLASAAADTRAPGYGAAIGRLLTGAEDGFDVDLLVQFAAFGEERYA